MKSILSILVSFVQMLSLFAVNIDHYEQEQSLPIIMYHHISGNRGLMNNYVISPEEFESDMAYLQENGYHAVLPSELESGNIPENPVMITFDDGFLSTYKYALPIMQKYSMKGVCAIVGALMQEYTENPNTVSDCAYMDMATVKALRDSGIFEIACHTYNMHSLGARKGCSKMKNENAAEYRAILTQDLNKFNTLYAEAIGGETNILAFPYGEYSSETVEIAKDCGYTIFLTCDEKVNRIRPDNEKTLVLGRFNRIHGITSEKFFNKMNTPTLLPIISEEFRHAVAGLS